MLTTRSSVLAELVKTDLTTPVRRRADAHGRRVPRAVSRAGGRRQPGTEPDLRGILPVRGARRQRGRRSFCDRYPDWKDSLVSQLQYHRLFSQAAGAHRSAPRFPEGRARPFEEFQLLSLLGKGGTSRVFLAQRPLAGGKAGRPEGLARPRSRAEDSRAARTSAYRPGQLGDLSGGPRLCGLSMPLSAGTAARRGHQAGRAVPAAGPGAGLVERAGRLGRRRSISPGSELIPALGTQALPAGRWLEGISQPRHLCAGRGLDRHGHGPGLALCPRETDPSPRRQARQYPAHDQSWPAIARLQPGRVAPFRGPCSGRDARRHAAVHGTEQIEAFLNPELWTSWGPSADIYSLGLVFASS